MKRSIATGAVAGARPLRLLFSFCQVCPDGVSVQEEWVVPVQPLIAFEVIVVVIIRVRITVPSGTRVGGGGRSGVIVVSELAVLAKAAFALFPEIAYGFVLGRRALEAVSMAVEMLCVKRLGCRARIRGNGRLEYHEWAVNSTSLWERAACAIPRAELLPQQVRGQVCPTALRDRRDTVAVDVLRAAISCLM